MGKLVRRTAQLGEVVAAAFDEAAKYSRDHEAVSRLATMTVMQMLRCARMNLLPPVTADTGTQPTEGRNNQ